MVAWVATPNASFANFWNSSRKSINFWFAGLKTSRWNLCFVVAIDWGFMYFLRNTVKISPKFSRWGWWCFWRFVVQLQARESGRSLFCLLPSVNCGFSNLFGTDLQTVRISLISHWHGHCRCEGFGQFRDSVNVVVEVGCISVCRQLLKG